MQVSDPVILAIITGVTSTIASLVTAYVAIRSSNRVAVVDSKVDAVVVKVEEVHKATNGLTEKLRDATLKEGVATGHAQGIQEQKVLTAIRENGIASGKAEERGKAAQTALLVHDSLALGKAEGKAEERGKAQAAAAPSADGQGIMSGDGVTVTKP